MSHSPRVTSILVMAFARSRMIPDRTGHKPSAVTSPRGTARSRRTEVPLFGGNDPAGRGMM